MHPCEESADLCGSIRSIALSHESIATSSLLKASAMDLLQVQLPFC